jgi:hypothetical protein
MIVLDPETPSTARSQSAVEPIDNLTAWVAETKPGETDRRTELLTR